ncbi:unnamed protein product [Blepharisma stoltei]|uniref:RRM domain-containing protein n=1 Tax=Blepharisma stoltei TaxID=1481888 RepID=A0AAU9K255_9CILI|nr:unnamed protein product [Blepharisma stoltei]
MQKNPRMIFVGNLPDGADYNALNEAFIPFGEIKNIDIPADPITKASRGFAFIEYEEEEDADHAIFNKHNSLMGENSLVVEHARPMRSKEFLNKPIWADSDYHEKYATAPDSQ